MGDLLFQEQYKKCFWTCMLALSKKEKAVSSSHRDIVRITIDSAHNEVVRISLTKQSAGTTTI